MGKPQIKEFYWQMVNSNRILACALVSSIGARVKPQTTLGVFSPSTSSSHRAQLIEIEEEEEKGRRMRMRDGKGTGQTERIMVVRRTLLSAAADTRE